MDQLSQLMVMAIFLPFFFLYLMSYMFLNYQPTFSPFTKSPKTLTNQLFDTHCVVQDWTTGRLWGFAKESNGLYYLEVTKGDGDRQLFVTMVTR